MARKAAGRSAASPPREAGMPPGAVEVEVVESKEVWSEYMLKDGTRLRIRPVLAGAFHIRDQWMPDGEPVYGVRVGFITDVRAPLSLRRKPSA
jgi:hypothetical protein